jgi:hypothetical protein
MSTLKGGQLTRFHATWIGESMQLRHVEDGWMDGRTDGLGTQDKLLLLVINYVDPKMGHY